MKSFTRVLVAVAAAALTVSVASVPASAVVVDTDGVRITEQELDFGLDWRLGAPRSDGEVEWDVAGGLTTPRATGKLYINNASGTCARMRVESYNLAHTMINYQNGGTVCASDGSLHKWDVDLAPAGHADTTHVHVILQVQNTNGTYSEVGRDTADLN